jgi:hypothetical protein
MELTIVADRPSAFARPLDEVRVRASEAARTAALLVLDGAHRQYVRRAVDGGEAAFTVAGALGRHAVVLLDADGAELERALLTVECRTEIDDGGGPFSELLRVLDYTMNRRGAEEMAPVDGRTYSYFVRWLRDHVHVLKGNKYFQAGLKSGIDLYLDTQCENGMVWDNVYPREAPPNWWEHHLAPEFYRNVTDGRFELKRIPVEADVEYLFVEGIYYTWKATGDTAWMRAALPGARRALHYCTSDRYRWSEKYGLVKRGYTIDTWDFLVAEDAAIYDHPMLVGPETRFGVMHGDNTGLMAACGQMAEMLEAVGEPGEAERYRVMGHEVKQRLDELAWNGRFYRHRVEEEPVERDLGVDEPEQISLSNSYALNRGIEHEQCVAVINEYRRIREELPHGSPGEWYAIYPWFERGFGRHCVPGEYMNGGVLTICAGELARGAFEHGFEAYGADILERLLGLARDQDGYLPCSFRGFLPPEPERSFTPLDLSGVANVDFRCDSEGDGWTGEPGNDLRSVPVGRQTFCGVPFDVLDPAANERRGCLALSRRGAPYAESARLALDGAGAGSLYFLHAASNTGQVAGEYTVHYTDGGREDLYLRMGREVTGWWQPHDTGPARLAWHGANPAFSNVGLVVYGWQNPHRDRPIAAVEMRAPKTGGTLLVAAVTLSDAGVWFEPSRVSYGIPDNWGAAAVVYGLIEGLAGVVDQGVAFDVAGVAPRWPAAGQDRVAVSVSYPASGGYVAYRYRHDEAEREIRLELAGSGGRFACHVLLPEGAERATSVTCDGAEVPFENAQVEGSRYADFVLEDLPAREVAVRYE